MGNAKTCGPQCSNLRQSERYRKRRKDPEYREHKREYQREYHQNPEVKERHRESQRKYMKDPANRERERERAREYYARKTLVIPLS